MLIALDIGNTTYISALIFYSVCGGDSIELRIPAKVLAVGTREFLSVYWWSPFQKRVNIYL